MFSVTPESSATSPIRTEPSRNSASDASARPNGFAALVDVNARTQTEPLRPATTDRRDSPQASTHPSRQDRDPPRDAAPDSSATPSDSRPDIEGTTAGKNLDSPAAKPAKQTKAGETSSDPTDRKAEQTSNADASAASPPGVPTDPTAVAVALTASPSVAATPDPATSSGASGPATAAPLSIAAAAIATSAQVSAMPAAPGGDTSPMIDAVAGAVSEMNATNFNIAKTIASTPVPAVELNAEAHSQRPTTPQLASAVATSASTVIKSGDKLPVPEMEPAADASPQGNTSQSPLVPQAGTAHTSVHPQGKADIDADQATADAATTPRGEHHTTATASQPQPTAPDVLPQLGATTTTTQTPSPAIIPAAQLTATVATNLAVPVSGLAMQIATSARAGNSRFEIRLDPAELGRIDIRLDVDRHGNVTSHLTVEKPETLAMLRQDAPQLQRSLEDAGLKTGQNGLQFSLRDQSTGQQHNNDGHTERQPQRLVISETAAAPLVAASATYSYAAGANRGLDIRV